MISAMPATTIGGISLVLCGMIFAAGALVGIVLNAIFPGKDYEFDEGV